MPDYVRRMRREDIDQVIEIDREAFPTEWPPPNFKRELENRMAHYIVACNAPELAEVQQEESQPPRTGISGLMSGIRRLFGQGDSSPREATPVGPERITGFAGFWVMADEAHITSIATRESSRGQGIGELLLQSTIDLAARLKARIVTLEVRASNRVAQRLYTKYGFSQVGLRRGYYTDNREDAILMSTDRITSPAFQENLRQLKKAYAEKWGPDRHGLSG